MYGGNTENSKPLQPKIWENQRIRKRMSLYEKSFVGREQQEESGWTAYLQDFSENNMMGSSSYPNQEDYDCSIVSSPSLVSDAATYAARRKKKSSSDHRRVRNNTECSSLGGSQVLRRLNLKNPKTSDKYYDPDLEDTASSPVNSPKDRTFKQQVEINPIRTQNNVLNYLGKETGFEGFQEMVMGAEEESSSINFDGKISTECIDLKKRGLCLMPLSLLVNYHKQSF